MNAPRAKAGQPYVQPMLDLHRVTIDEDMPVQYAEEDPFTGWMLPLAIVLVIFVMLCATLIAGVW